MSLLNNCSTEQLIQYVESSTCYKQVLEKLGYRACSGSVQQLLRERLRAENISTEHFIAPTGDKIVKRTKENTFCENSTVDQKTLRKKYFQDNYSEYKCSICGQDPYWNGKSMTLILDHINGINNDDRLENLRWVCPNCNSQLETTNGKNIQRLREFGLLGELKTKKYYCQDCGKELSASSATRCAECSSKNQRKVERPIREELKQLIRTKSFTSIGASFGVADNTIRKWCKAENLPSTKKDISQYSDEEWIKI